MSLIVSPKKVCAECIFWPTIDEQYRTGRSEKFNSKRIRECKHVLGRLCVARALTDKKETITEVQLREGLVAGTISELPEDNPTFLVLEKGQPVPAGRNAIRVEPYLEPQENDSCL